MLFFAGLGNVAAADRIDLREMFRNGRWRLEAQGYSALYSGKTDREGDKFATFSVEYEMPATRRFAFGLRAYPLFYYEPHRSSFDNVYGVAVGGTARYYLRAETYNGWFADAGCSILWHSNYFHDNSSRVNFMPEGGVGYQFRNNWHAAVKLNHISNGGMASKNAGVNALGLAIGYTF